jgi:hypothetical protein
VGHSQFWLSHELGYKKGLYSIDYDDATLDRLVKNKEITPELAKWVKENRSDTEGLVKEGLNVGRIAEALYAEKSHKAPFGLPIPAKYWFPGKFNKWVFEDVSRGVMTQAAVKELNRIKQVNPDWTDQKAKQYVAKQINISFGNLQRQGVLKSEAARDMANILLLAPQWTESMLQKEARGYAQGVKAVAGVATGKGLKTGTQLKLMATALGGMFVANQVINMAFQKKPTWENEEGHKWDAKLPGGQWLSPFSDQQEYYNDLAKYKAKGDSTLETGQRILENKLSPIARSEEAFRLGRDYNGTKLDDTDRITEAIKALVPTPLPMAGYFSPTPGQGARQGYSALGLKTEPEGKYHEKEIEKAVGEVKNFADLTFAERLTAEDKVKSSKPAMDDKTKLRVEERGEELAQKRAIAVRDSLDKSNKTWLESRGLSIPQYGRTIMFSKKETGKDHATAVQLTDDEMKYFSGLLKEYYNKALPIAKKDYDSLPDSATKKRYFSLFTSSVQKLARETMKEQMAGLSNSENESHSGNDKNKEFSILNTK